MRFNRVKCKVWHLDCGNFHYQHRLGDIRMDHSPTKNNSGVLVDDKLNISQQNAFSMKQLIVHLRLEKHKLALINSYVDTYIMC